MSVQTFITNKGVALIAKSIANSAAIAFVSAEIGTGALVGDAKGYTGLKTKYADAMLSKTTYEGNATLKFSAQYTASGLLEPVLITEIGVFATDPDDGKILFAYTNLGDNPDRLFPSSDASFFKFYDVTLVFTTSNGVTVTINPSALVPAKEVVAVATAGKILKLDANAKLPASITGDANTVGGKSASAFAEVAHGHSNATSSADGFMSSADKIAHDALIIRAPKT